MGPAEFRLESHWRVPGAIGDVYDILSKPREFVRWWPSVYLNVEEIEPGDADGLGRVLRLHTKGRLPYTISWQATAVVVEKPHRIVIEARGDLTGRGEWRLTQSGDSVDANYTWTVRTTKPWMRVLAPVLRPLFAANHRWAMREGEMGLRRELERHASLSQ